MTLHEFAEITLRVIAKDGFADYRPTALYPERCHVMVLAGMPHDVDPEGAALAWATAHAHGDEEFLVAFKVDDAHFKVVRRFAGTSESAQYLVPDA